MEEEEHELNKLLIEIVFTYISNLSTTCDWGPQILTPSKQHLKEIFMVPRLKEFHQTKSRINLLQAFLTLLLQLLYHKTDWIVGPFKDGIGNLEKELRYVLTIVGDISWMMCDRDEHHAGFHELLPHFEALANEAGSFVHYLFFSNDRAIEKTGERLAAVINQTDLLKANLQSTITVSPYSTSRVDSVIILDSIVDLLADLLRREDDRTADLKDQIKLLHQGLMGFHASIKEFRSPQPSEIEELKEPLLRIGGIAHQAEYLITSFLVKDAPLWYVISRLIDLNHRIEPIRAELQLITLKYQFGGLKVAEAPLQDKRHDDVDDTNVGFEGKTREILSQLVGSVPKVLQVISILGMPGIGKTTLAYKLYNLPSVGDWFDKISWSVVSQTYERLSILTNILININSELGKDMILNMEEIRLKEYIHKTLMGRRYLIVLDDIWDSRVLNEFLTCFPDDENGSRILVTSRNKDVAPPPPNSTIHELPFLSDEQCWELLQKKVFGSRTFPPKLQGIGKKIAARCCGLPLTVVVLAGVLSNVDEEESRWVQVGGSLASYTGNSVMQILELSYKHLPDHLKPCFLYFGEFKEDKEISAAKLKRLWVAEGFIHKIKDKSVESVAGEYLMELIDKNLVMIARRGTDGRGIRSCVVHDLLRDFCLKKCKEESFLKYLNNDYQTIYEKGHRVRAFGDSSALSSGQHVRSFIGDCQSSAFYVRDMILLRVLHFKTIDIFKKTPTFGTEYLVNLRFLVIDDVPSCIDQLVNLEYLRLEAATVYLPPTIVKMKMLRHLRAYHADYCEDWSINSNQTNNLEYLSKVSIRKLKDEEVLKCSPHLRKLKCIYNTPKGLEKEACPHFDLCFLTKLESLFLIGFLRKGDFVFPSNIRELTLCRSRLPWEKMSIVGGLEFLEVLRLRDNAFVGERWDTSDGEFQNLMFLQLEEVYLSEWNVASCDHFPKLQRLMLISCVNLREFSSEMGGVTTLELIEVKNRCPYSVVESAERIKQEQWDMGNDELRVINGCYLRPYSLAVSVE